MKISLNIDQIYSKMVFDGYKPVIFLNEIDNEVETVLLNNKVMRYDKDKRVDVNMYIYESKHKSVSKKAIGEVTVIDYYYLYYGNKKWLDIDLVDIRNNFIKNLYFYWCDFKKIKPNMNEGWFKSKKFIKYQKEIGFYGNDDTLNCNYALIVNNPILY